MSGGGDSMEPAIDMDAVKACTGGDHEMVTALAELFLEEAPKQLSEIEAQVTAGKFEAIRDGAHKLKGSVMIFGAVSTEAAARELESAAERASSDDVLIAWAQLQRETNRVLADVERLCHPSDG